MDMRESYNKLVIAWAILVPHVGYWHGSDVEPTCGTRIARAITNTYVYIMPVIVCPLSQSMCLAIKQQ